MNSINNKFYDYSEQTQPKLEVQEDDYGNLKFTDYLSLSDLNFSENLKYNDSYTFMDPLAEDNDFTFIKNKYLKR